MPRLGRSFLPVRPQRLYAPAVVAPSVLLARQAGSLALRGNRPRPVMRPVLLAVPTRSVAFARSQVVPRRLVPHLAGQPFRLPVPPPPVVATPLRLPRTQAPRMRPQVLRRPGVLIAPPPVVTGVVLRRLRLGVGR